MDGIVYPMFHKKKYAGVLFDLDGTLVYNYAAIHATICEVFARHGVECPSLQLVARTVGGSILVTISRLLAPFSLEDKAQEYTEEYMEIFPKNVFVGLELIKGADFVLKALHSEGVKTACFTNKHEDGALAILERLDLLKYLDCVIATTINSPRKPEAKFTLAALEKMGLAPCEALGVGDSPFDYMAAQNGGIDSALVATGTDSLADLRTKCPKAVGVFRNMESLARDLLGIRA